VVWLKLGITERSECGGQTTDLKIKHRRISTVTTKLQRREARKQTGVEEVRNNESERDEMQEQATSVQRWSFGRDETLFNAEPRPSYDGPY
jgi:hypothetical protein